MPHGELNVFSCNSSGTDRSTHAQYYSALTSAWFYKGSHASSYSEPNVQWEKRGPCNMVRMRNNFFALTVERERMSRCGFSTLASYSIGPGFDSSGYFESFVLFFSLSMKILGNYLEM
jgi:hypothetical protein